MFSSKNEIERLPRRMKRFTNEKFFHACENSSSESDDKPVPGQVSAIDDAISLEQHGGTSGIYQCHGL